MSLNFGEYVKEKSPEIQREFNRLRAVYNDAENALISYALEHSIELDIDGMGTLVHGPDEDARWSSHERGQWYTSTDSCS
jgi:hypothetical protein